MPDRAVGYLVGTFDLFHVGHLDALRRAADACDRLVVGVTSDALAARTGGAPYVPEVERRAIVGAVRCVAEVVAVDDADLAAQVAATGADVLFAAELDGASGRLLAGAGDVPARVVPLPLERHTASTAVRDALDDRSDRSSVA